MAHLLSCSYKTATPSLQLMHVFACVCVLCLCPANAEYNYSTAAPPSMQNDTITISRHHSTDPGVKLAICHALAQVWLGKTGMSHVSTMT